MDGCREIVEEESFALAKGSLGLSARELDARLEGLSWVAARGASALTPLAPGLGVAKIGAHAGNAPLLVFFRYDDRCVRLLHIEWMATGEESA